MKPSINKYLEKETEEWFEPLKSQLISITISTDKNPTEKDIKEWDKKILQHIRENYPIEKVERISKLHTKIQENPIALGKITTLSRLLV